MWDDPRQLNAAALGLALVAVALLAWGGVAWLARQPVFAFGEVVVRGPLERASRAHLEAVIRDELAGTFFTLNLERARASLARVPWVRSVALRRHWPRRLEVTVVEHEPLARWNDAALVNAQGEVFAADFDGELPAFTGPEGTASEVTGRYREWSTALSPLALAVRDVTLSARGGWQLVATGAGGPIEIELGREEPSARLARFVAVWGRTVGALARAGTRIGHVDLRYRNGFAAKVPGFRERPAKKAA
jgi:cell division protein FtsQ